MANSDYLKGARLPSWLSWHIDYGLEGLTEADQRKKFVANLFCAINFFNSCLYAAICLALDFTLWPSAMVSIIYAIAFLPGPVLFRRSPGWSVTYSVAVACLVFPIQAFLLGKDSGLHLLLIVTPCVTSLCLGRNRIGLTTILIAVSVFTLFATQVFSAADLLPCESAFFS